MPWKCVKDRSGVFGTSAFDELPVFDDYTLKVTYVKDQDLMQTASYVFKRFLGKDVGFLYAYFTPRKQDSVKENREDNKNLKVNEAFQALLDGKKVRPKGKGGYYIMENGRPTWYRDHYLSGEPYPQGMKHTKPSDHSTGYYLQSQFAPFEVVPEFRQLQTLLRIPMEDSLYDLHKKLKSIGIELEILGSF